MKIGFLGCSYSSYSQKYVHENSWTYQISQRYPHHQYYNYAKGGQGIDHVQWCLLDAKEQEIDMIFLNTTYPSRVGYLVDKLNNDIPVDNATDEFIYETTKISDNFSLRELLSPWVWASHAEVGGTRTNIRYGRTFQDVINVQAVSNVRQSYVRKFYENVSKLYNFKHFIVLNFVNEYLDNEKDSSTVWHKIRTHWNAHTPNELYNAGITLSEDDDHWTYKGNEWVLDNFILTENVIDILEKK